MDLPSTTVRGGRTRACSRRLRKAQNMTDPPRSFDRLCVRGADWFSRPQEWGRAASWRAQDAMGADMDETVLKLLDENDGEPNMPFYVRRRTRRAPSRRPEPRVLSMQAS